MRGMGAFIAGTAIGLVAAGGVAGAATLRSSEASSGIGIGVTRKRVFVFKNGHIVYSIAL